MRLILKLYLKVFLVVSFTLFYCEYLIYYLVIKQCSWPDAENEHDNTTLKAMFLADTHLLGPYSGHWFDKLRREWQMYRSFQNAVSIYEPEVVFILGDLFDEGQWCDSKQFQDYINRFFSLFEVPKNTKLYVVPGNHDIGFHEGLRYILLHKFGHVFNIFSVEFLDLKGNYFILLNSMAMTGDGCYLCSEAEEELLKISRNLNCMKDQRCSHRKSLKTYSRPIVLQHFPMYRKSDAKCNETDEAPPDLKNQIFEENWDCLSKEASQKVLRHLLPETILGHPFPEPALIRNIYKKLNPRAIFTGHVHHGCHTIHRGDIHEYTLPSFSWRNKNNPTFMLVKITPEKYSINKCHLPRESTVIFIYSSVILGIIMYVLHFGCLTQRYKYYVKCILYHFKKHIKNYIGVLLHN